MDSKHTAEDWSVVQYGDGDSLVVHSGPHERVCFMATPGESPGAMKRIEANARLIAAAPDLLEAAKLFIAYDAPVHDDGVTMMLAYADALEAAKDAIAKAEGPAQ